MVRSFIQLFTVLSLSVFALPAWTFAQTTDDNAPSMEVIHSVRLVVPHGLSDWTLNLAANPSNPLQMLFVKEASCASVPTMVQVFVRNAQTHLWERTEYKEGYDYHSGGNIDGLRFRLEQHHWIAKTCTLRIYGQKGGAVAPQPQPGTLVGAIPYTGGFKKEAILEISPARFVTSIRVEVPKFCAETEVLELFTLTEGVFDKAELIDKATHTYAVNDGAGMRISKVMVSLNGPANLQCQLPVYFYQ